MDAIRLSRAALALLILVVLVGGVVLGSAVSALMAPPQAVPASVASQSPASPSTVAPPREDVAGDDVARLPRFPGSVRTEYDVNRDGRFRLIAVEYFADDRLDNVRAFYQDMIELHGWQRADITYAGGEWTYLLVDGSTNALVELEVTRGLIEIDIQVSDPTSDRGEESTPAPAPTQRAMTSPAPPAPAPPRDDDDGGDDSDDGGESDG